MAAGRAVLPVQDVPHGDDVVGVDLDHHSVHGRALCGHLSPAARARRLHAAARRQDHRRRLGGRLRHRAAVPAPHQDVLLRRRPDATSTSARRVAHLQHSDALAGAHAILLPGESVKQRSL